MKKTFIFIFVAALLPSMAFAQLKVSSYGNVTISAPTQGTTLSLESQDKAYWPLSLAGKNKGLKISLENTTSDATVASYALHLSTKNYADVSSHGIFANATNYGTSSRVVGISGTASGKSSGDIVGVYGGLTTTLNGAGIYGGTTISPVAVDGRYAGYFRGNVKVTGTIDGTLVTTSDGQLKENVQSIEADADEGEGVLAKLELLTPVTYNYKDTNTATAGHLMNAATREGDAVEDDLDILTDEVVDADEPNQVMLKKHFGFIAQELQQVYPDLVYEQDNGYLAVNYTELIPILVQSIKELNAKVEELSANGRVSRSPLLRDGEEEGVGEEEVTAIDNALAASDMASMSQNVPNPFTEKTDIAIYLPETVQTATLYIYDLSGKQLEQHLITGRGDTVMTIHADKMDAGMYVYSLIADRKVVTTKKMIVVK
ncbi:MAG: tail fiber domain-containing protein [Prevotella sp.]|nr:tail fiber domain-containing protein [Prevotella sp.]